MSSYNLGDTSMIITREATRTVVVAMVVTWACCSALVCLVASMIG